jgi:hypothetical protein
MSQLDWLVTLVVTSFSVVWGAYLYSTKRPNG